MNVDIRMGDLEENVKKALTNWAENDVHKAVNIAIKETAEETAKLLRKGGPYQDRKGRKYSKGWSYKQRTRNYNPITMTETWSVYNKKQYRLTHLLEKGHRVVRNGKDVGKAKAYEHIAPAQDFARDYLASAINRHIGGG